MKNKAFDACNESLFSLSTTIRVKEVFLNDVTTAFFF